ncbi:DUF2191 domain-containing protein [Nocardioides flavescens]|uniref:DUF2191 domain-containing protein n=1 Tax=Nocardioides flavescens TaxID=2691959 RepID=A0A6L7F2L4_9ACTN|nr:DUF2191 domain-containing protein [Nocardioides flavescens]MXG91252.1 DUF2191 domain-containing protein [Nocardioides flavescens]
MKTTIELPDELVREVKQLAAESGATMRDVVVEGLRRELRRRREAGAARPDFVFRTVGGDGISPDVDASDVLRHAYDLPAL